ncbi:hypothetical protein K8T06_05645, partial [bacterium]|nr:hypothetical protein [bacterium]
RAICRVDRKSVREILGFNKNDLKNMEMIVTLSFDHDQLKTILGNSSSDWQETMIKSLAKAMPYMDKVEMRTDPLQRQRIYQNMWGEYFNDRKCTFREVKAYGKQELEMLKVNYKIGPYVYGDPKLVYQNPLSFSGQLYKNGKTATNYSGIVSKWEMFSNSLRKLKVAMDSDLDSYQIEHIFEGLSAFFRQYLYVRATGVFLLYLADAAKIEPSDINSSLRIHLGKENKDILFRKNQV